MQGEAEVEWQPLLILRTARLAQRGRAEELFGGGDQLVHLDRLVEVLADAQALGVHLVPRRPGCR